jgi:hypothetical protein
MGGAKYYILGCISVPVISLGKFLVILSLINFGHFGQLGESSTCGISEQSAVVVNIQD